MFGALVGLVAEVESVSWLKRPQAMPAGGPRSDPGKNCVLSEQNPFHSCCFSHRVPCEWLETVASSRCKLT